LLNWFYDIFDNIEIREDIKTKSVIPSIIVIGIATILEVSFVAIIATFLFF
jgi:hypothetical protein